MANLSILTGKGGSSLSAIVSILVAVIVVATVLSPIISDATSEKTTEHNTPELYFSDEPATINCSVDKNWYVDGTAVTTHSTGMLISDKGFAYMDIGAHTAGNLYLSDGTYATVRNIKVTDTGFSYSVNTAPGTYIDVPCEWVYYSVDSGEYGKYSTTSFNVNPSSNVVVALSVGTDSNSNTVKGTANLCPTETVNFFELNNVLTSGATIESDATITETEFGYSTYSDGSWTVTYDSGTVTGSWVIAPNDYLKTVQSDSIEATILKVIPVMICLAILIGVATTMVGKRND